MERGPRLGQVDGLDGRHHLAQPLDEVRFAEDPAQHEVVGRFPRDQVQEQRILSVSHRGDLEHVFRGS